MHSILSWLYAIGPSNIIKGQFIVILMTLPISISHLECDLSIFVLWHRSKNYSGPQHHFIFYKEAMSTGTAVYILHWLDLQYEHVDMWFLPCIIVISKMSSPIKRCHLSPICLTATSIACQHAMKATLSFSQDHWATLQGSVDATWRS